MYLFVGDWCLFSSGMSQRGRKGKAKGTAKAARKSGAADDDDEPVEEEYNDGEVPSTAKGRFIAEESQSPSSNFAMCFRLS